MKPFFYLEKTLILCLVFPAVNTIILEVIIKIKKEGKKMFRVFSKIFLLFIFFSVVNVFAGKVFEERLNYKIITPDNPTKVQSFAASELKKILKKSYARSIVLNGKTDKITFYVGFSGDAILAGFDKIPDMKGKFGIFRKDSNFLFFGEDYKNLDPVNNPHYIAGTLSSVYYFLTKYTGTKFYFPGEKGYALSPENQLLFKGTVDIPKPSFEVRGITSSTKEFTSKELNIFTRSNLCNIPFWSKKDLYYVFMYKWKKRFWKTHPDYFMQRDGKTVSQIYPLHVPCFSNPAVIRQAAADIVSAINRKPSIRVVRMFCDAPVNQCSCPRCSAAPERRYCGKDVKQGEEFYGFQKKVIDLVHEALPDIYFISQTKGRYYSHPPEMVKMGPLFTMEILTYRPAPNREYEKSVKLMKEWKDTGVRTTLKSYTRYGGLKKYPIMNSKFLQKYLRQFAGLAGGTMYSDLSGNIPYAFCARGQLIQTRLLFDVNVDVDSLTADFCSFAYPGAEKEMIAFYDEMERLFSKNKSMNDDPFIWMYYPEKLKKAMSLIDAAAKKVKKDSVWFKPLEKAFRKFYAEAWQKKPQVDILLKAAPLKIIAVPMLKTPVDFKNKIALDMWDGAIKEKFYPAKIYSDFQESKAYIGYDKENLYFGLLAFEKHNKSLKQTCLQNHKGAIWSDDCFEIMLVPSKDNSFYYQIIVNSLGVYRVLLKEKGKEDCEDKTFNIEIKNKIEKDRWVLELKIPLKQFDSYDFNHKWRFNIFRTRITTLKNMKQASGLRIFSGSYHNLEQYHYLTWPKEIKRKKSFLSKIKFW
jgi:Domain of unknown function (DUF4838)